jgi:hypothetical protein
VFINCPYDPVYARIFEALIFAVHALGFVARAAREIDDGAANPARDRTDANDTPNEHKRSG